MLKTAVLLNIFVEIENLMNKKNLLVITFI